MRYALLAIGCVAVVALLISWVLNRVADLIGALVVSGIPL